ncbi:folate-binding protein, partial [Lysobacter lacus]
MNDVAELVDGDWQWSGWLDPKGRVHALFALLRRDAECVWLVGTADADALGAALGRFVFRSKVKFEPAAMVARGRLANPHAAIGAHAASGPDGVELDLSGDAGARTLLLEAGHPVGSANPGKASEWWALDIAHGWPALPGVQLGAWTPQQLSLQRLSAFSVKKGCYPGQEIVARTHFLGRAKRGMALLSVDAPPGAMLTDAAGRDTAQVVTSAGGASLAVVPLEPSDLQL